jgi:hypothetical protein
VTTDFLNIEICKESEEFQWAVPTSLKLTSGSSNHLFTITGCTRKSLETLVIRTFLSHKEYKQTGNTVNAFATDYD